MFTTSALGHADLSRSTGLPRVKPDQWVPLVSVTVLARVTDVWAQSTATSGQSTLTRGSIVINLSLTNFVRGLNKSVGHVCQWLS